MNTATLRESLLPPPSAVQTSAPAGVSWRGVLWGLLVRDLRLALRRPVDVAAGLMFFVVTASLYPLAVGSEAALLARLAPGVLWVAALLASLLSLRRLFDDEWADGGLDLLVLSPVPLPLVVLAKVLAQWLCSGALLVLASPVLATQFGLTSEAIGLLALTLLLGTPVLSLLGAIGAALTLGLRGAAVLTALLVLPLCVPVLVFGAGAVEAHAAGLPVGGHLSLLGAMLLLSLLGAPFACAAALRLAVESA